MIFWKSINENVELLPTYIPILLSNNPTLERIRMILILICYIWQFEKLETRANFQPVEVKTRATFLHLYCRPLNPFYPTFYLVYFLRNAPKIPWSSKIDHFSTQRWVATLFRCSAILTALNFNMKMLMSNIFLSLIVLEIFSKTPRIPTSNHCSEMESSSFQSTKDKWWPKSLCATTFQQKTFHENRSRPFWVLGVCQWSSDSYFIGMSVCSGFLVICNVIDTAIDGVS